MSYTHSLTLAATAADRDAVNAYFEALGWGTPVLTVSLSPDGLLPVTHYGAHTYQSEEVVATLQAAAESEDPALDGIDGLFIYAVETSGVAFEQALQSAEAVTAFGSTLQAYYPVSEM